MSHSASIVGYTFNGNIVCPACIMHILPTGPGQPYDGWQLAPGIQMSTEDNLNEIAYAFGIDRQDETTFDSASLDGFPKVVLGQMLEAGQCCDACQNEL